MTHTKAPEWVVEVLPRIEAALESVRDCPAPGLTDEKVDAELDEIQRRLEALAESVRGRFLEPYLEERRRRRTEDGDDACQRS